MCTLEVYIGTSVGKRDGEERIYRNDGNEMQFQIEVEWYYHLPEFSIFESLLDWFLSG